MDIVQSQPYDLLLRGGRVIDPAQGLDGLFDVAVRDGRIAAVAKNLPGFVAEALGLRNDAERARRIHSLRFFLP